MSDEQQAGGWIAAGLALLVALVGWGRAFFTKKQDITHDFAHMMKARIEALEARDKQSDEREDTLRTQVEEALKTANEYREQLVSLRSEHSRLLTEYQRVIVEHSELVETNRQLLARNEDVLRENEELMKQNRALSEELHTLYRQISGAQG